MASLLIALRGTPRASDTVIGMETRSISSTATPHMASTCE